jgi:CubicO group peptidase (beta-lactamase class C family)
MRRTIILPLFLLSLFIEGAFGQSNLHFVDSIRKAYGIPEVSYCVVSDSAILEIAAVGYHSVNLPDTASLDDRFHIGSNTKAMTAFIIAKFVENGKLTWATKFFDIYPTWKDSADPAYYNITLENLLSHRARIQPFQGDNDPVIPNFSGTKQQKRMAFGKFVLSLAPAKTDSLNQFAYSNAGYTLAALMVEKVTGLSWEQLVENIFNNDLHLDVKFSWPENQKRKDTWGHIDENNKLIPVPSTTDYRLDYTEPAGDINIKMKDYAKFIQLNIQGLKGYDNYLKASDYKFIHTGIPYYSLGWFNSYEGGNSFSVHDGTAGTYFTLVAIDRKKHIGYIIFTNSYNDNTKTGIRLIMRRLRKTW